MELRFQVYGNIATPVAEVFDAVYNPSKLSGYFTTGGASAPLVEGSTVTWDFADFPGAFPVQVIEVQPDRKIVLEWKANEGEPPNVEGGGLKEVGYNTTVTMTFTPLEDDTRTMVEIEEKGWRETEGALKASYGNCQGWAQMLAALKAWVEYGINLRDGMYK